MEAICPTSSPHRWAETKAGGAARLFSSIHPTPTQVKTGAGVLTDMVAARTAALLLLRSGLRVSPCSPAGYPRILHINSPGHKWGLWSLPARMSLHPHLLVPRTNRQKGSSPHPQPCAQPPEHPPGLSPAQPPASFLSPSGCDPGSNAALAPQELAQTMSMAGHPTTLSPTFILKQRDLLCKTSMLL